MLDGKCFASTVNWHSLGIDWLCPKEAIAPYMDLMDLADQLNLDDLLSILRNIVASKSWKNYWLRSADAIRVITHCLFMLMSALCGDYQGKCRIKFFPPFWFVFLDSPCCLLTNSMGWESDANDVLLRWRQKILRGEDVMFVNNFWLY